MKKKVLLITLITLIVLVSAFFITYYLVKPLIFIPYIPNPYFASSGPISFEEVNIGCLPGLTGNFGTFVVRNQKEYDNLKVEYDEKTREEYKKIWGVTTDEELNRGSPFKDCDGKLMPIDFNKYSLLSNSASGSGCTTDFNNTIVADSTNKKVIFTIKVTENGSCEPMRYYRANVLIPRLPDDFTVEFNVE